MNTTSRKGITAVNKEKVVGACCCEYFNIFFSHSIERVASEKKKQNCEFNQRHDNAKERLEKRQQWKLMCVLYKNFYFVILRSGLKYEYNKTTTTILYT